jgi:hypothetical protein
MGFKYPVEKHASKPLVVQNILRSNFEVEPFIAQ